MKIHEIFFKILYTFFVLFYNVYIEKMFTIAKEDGRTVNCKPIICILCLSVCLFVTDKRQHGWIDRAQIFVGPQMTCREGLWIVRIEKKIIFFTSTKKIEKRATIKSLNQRMGESLVSYIQKDNYYLGLELDWEDRIS